MEEGGDGVCGIAELRKEMDGGNINFEYEGQGYEVREIESMKAMMALTTAEADSMSALMFRMSQADKAVWADNEVFAKKTTKVFWINKRGRFRLNGAGVCSSFQ